MCNWRPIPFSMGNKLTVLDSQHGGHAWSSLLRDMSPGWIVSPGSIAPHYTELAATAWAGRKDCFPCPFPVDWPSFAHFPGPQAGGSMLPAGRQVMASWSLV